MALANQGETVLAWDRRSGRALTPAIVWQDRRSAGICQRLSGSAGRLAAITGLPLDPYFAAPKMTWLRENLTTEGVVTTTDTWLLARLGAGYVTDAATASRTLLLDLATADWSAEACGVFGIDPRNCPRSATAPGSWGRPPRSARRCRSPGWPWTSRPLCSPSGASPRARPSAPTEPGRSCWPPPGRRRSGPRPGCPPRSPGGWAGRPPTVSTGRCTRPGAAVRWLTGLGLLPGAEGLDAAGASVPDSGGAVFVPALAGLGAPHWRPDARGAFLGLGMGVTRAHLARAVIEGIAASVALLAAAVTADIGAPLGRLRADGGLTGPGCWSRRRPTCSRRRWR